MLHKLRAMRDQIQFSARPNVRSLRRRLSSIFHELISSWALARYASPRLTLAAAVLLAIACVGYSAGHLRINTDTSAMLSRSLDFQKRQTLLESKFPQLVSDLYIVVSAPTQESRDAFSTALSAILEKRPSAVSSVFAGSADPFFRKNGLLFLSQDELANEINALSQSAGLIEALSQKPGLPALFEKLADYDELSIAAGLSTTRLSKTYDAVSDAIDAALQGERQPFSWRSLGSDLHPEEAEGVTIITVSPKLDYNKFAPARAAIAEIRTVIAELRKQDQFRSANAVITGEPALRGEELQSVSSGIELSLVLSLALVSAALYACFRSLKAMCVLLAGLIVSIIYSAAFAAAVFDALNLISIAFFVLMVGLGLDFGIHFLLRLQWETSINQQKADALRTAISAIAAPLAVSALTTCIGFLAFAPTEFIGMAQLGVLGAVGVLISFGTTLTIGPAAFGAFGLSKNVQPRQRSAVHLTASHRKFFAIAVIAMAIASAPVAINARFDPDPMSLRDPSTPSVWGYLKLLERDSTTPLRLTVFASNADEAAQIEKKAADIPTVSSVISLQSYIPSEQDEKLDVIDFGAGPLAFLESATPSSSSMGDVKKTGDLLKNELQANGPEENRRSRTRLRNSLVAILDRPSALALLEQNLFETWPAFIGDLSTSMQASHIDVTALPTPLVDRYRAKDGTWRIDLLPAGDMRNEASRRDFVKNVKSVFPDVVGAVIHVDYAGKVVSRAMLEAFAVALFFVLLLLFAVFGDFVRTALAIAPLLMAASITAAISSVFNLPFNYANVIVIPLLIGAGVDSSIHLISSVFNAPDVAGGDISPVDTLTKKAVLYSALTTIASFGSLAFSHHPGTASMGLLLVIAISSSLLCTLGFIPGAILYLRGLGRA